MTRESRPCDIWVPFCLKVEYDWSDIYDFLHAGRGHVDVSAWQVSLRLLKYFGRERLKTLNPGDAKNRLFGVKTNFSLLSIEKGVLAPKINSLATC